MDRKTIKRTGVSTALAVILVSCSVNDGLQDMTSLLGEGVYALTLDPECGEALHTKAISTDLKFTFTDSDDISVYPESSTTHMVYRLVPDESDAKKATFNSEDFDLQDNKTYYAFYPDKANSNGASQVEVSFTGQAQSANNSTAHLSDYDYQTAKTTISDNSGVFQFTHKVSWLKITIQATEAATLKTVTVSADEGVANTIVFDLLEDTSTPSRQSGDCLTLTLGGTEGISVAASGAVTAYITLPSDTYTNLTVTAEDSDGKQYVKVYSGEKTLEAGKYYIPTLLRTDIPEDTPFTRLTAFGKYSSTNSSTPSGIKLYSESSDQMSYGTSSSSRTFKLADMTTNSFAIFTVSSSTLTVGESYTVTSDVNGTKTQSSCKAVKYADGCVWLEDKTNNIGYIFAVE